MAVIALVAMLCLLLHVFGALGVCECAKILAIAPMPSYSHQISYRPIWRKLLSHGHQITLLTTDPMRDTGLSGLTQIDLHFSYGLWNETQLHNASRGFYELLMIRRDMFSNLIDKELESPEVRDLIQDKTQSFDLMMIEFLYPTMYR